MKFLSKINRKHVLTFVWVVLMFGMFFPMMHWKIRFFVPSKLHGWAPTIEIPEYNADNWHKRRIQNAVEYYASMNFYLRPYFIRLRNQLDFSLFKESNSNGVVVGREGYLYEERYIDSELGLNFVGDSVIQSKTEKLKILQDSLAENDVHLCVIMAPGKASFFPEYFPKKYDGIKKGRTNYDGYLENFKKHEVQHLNFKEWFFEMRDTATYPLFPQCGIHWSMYSEVFVADSILNYVREVGGKYTPKMVLESVSVFEENRDQDFDIGRGANLIFDPKAYPTAYPHCYINVEETLPQSKALVIADSYYWGVYNRGLSRDGMGDGEFWFYNEQIHPVRDGVERKFEDFDLKEELLNQDFIFLLFTDATLDRFSYGFIDNGCEAFGIKKGE